MKPTLSAALNQRRLFEKFMLPYHKIISKLSFVKFYPVVLEYLIRLNFFKSTS